MDIRKSSKHSKVLNSWEYIQQSLNSPSNAIPEHKAHHNSSPFTTKNTVHISSEDPEREQVEDINISSHFDQRIRNGFIRYLEHHKVPEISSTFSQKMQYQGTSSFVLSIIRSMHVRFSPDKDAFANLHVNVLISTFAEKKCKGGSRKSEP